MPIPFLLAGHGSVPVPSGLWRLCGRSCRAAAEIPPMVYTRLRGAGGTSSTEW